MMMTTKTAAAPPAVIAATNVCVFAHRALSPAMTASANKLRRVAHRWNPAFQMFGQWCGIPRQDVAADQAPTSVLALSGFQGRKVSGLPVCTVAFESARVLAWAVLSLSSKVPRAPWDQRSARAVPSAVLRLPPAHRLRWKGWQAASSRSANRRQFHCCASAQAIGVYVLSTGCAVLYRLLGKGRSMCHRTLHR